MDKHKQIYSARKKLADEYEILTKRTDYFDESARMFTNRFGVGYGEACKSSRAVRVKREKEEKEAKAAALAALGTV